MALTAVPELDLPADPHGRCGEGLFNGDCGNPEVAIGASITAMLTVIAVWIASRAFSRANA